MEDGCRFLRSGDIRVLPGKLWQIKNAIQGALPSNVSVNAC